MTNGARYLERSCPLCQSKAFAVEVQSELKAEDLAMSGMSDHWSGLFKEKVFFSYSRCRDCGLLFAPTYFTPDQLASLYTNMAPNMDVVRSDALVATQRGYWDRAVQLGNLSGGYLEIGPDVGYIVERAVAEGRFHKLWLFEPNAAVHAKLAASARSVPHVISPAMEDFSGVPDGSVGLAFMVHVLDHMLEPVAALTQIRRKLRPGGKLVIVTHNEQSLLRTAMGTRWPPFCLQHPQIYNPDSIRRMIRTCGYSDVVVERSVNYFPIDFMLRQAAYSLGFSIGNVPLPKTVLGLKLGNMITIATY